MDNICVDCRKSADCKRKPRADQWTVAGCYWFEADTVITNADRIRAMTDEELAICLANLASCPECYARREDCGINCWEAWLNWLKSQTEVDE